MFILHGKYFLIILITFHEIYHSDVDRGNWGNYQFHNSAQLSALVQLAVALVAELELGRKPRHVDSKKSLAHATGLEVSAPAKATNVHSLEDMRAFLGVFYLSSMFVSLFSSLVLPKA